MEASTVIYLGPLVAALALVYAAVRAAWVKRQDQGTDRMRMIGGWVSQGAMAFLAREYRALAIFVFSVAILIGVSNAYIGEAQDTNADYS